MSFHYFVTIITFILLSLVIFLGRHEIVQAWGLLGSVDIWILSLLVPIQLLSYYASAGMIFSYLRTKGDLKNTSHWQMTRIALELNFVHHILPSGGIAGFSYLSWLLHHHGVSISRSTMAQFLRYGLTFLGFVVILFGSVITLFLDHQINKMIVVISVVFAILAIGTVVFVGYFIDSKKRMKKMSNWVTHFVNTLISKITRGRKRNTFEYEKVEKFFIEINQDWVSIKKDKKILIKPFIWSLIANTLDVALIAVAFCALGTAVNPAILFIAFGISSVVGILSAIPGGAGVYDTVMIAFLASAGIPVGVAIAGTLLARVVLLLGTIIFGYIFYQLTINKYGKIPNTTII